MEALRSIKKFKCDASSSYARDDEVMPAGLGTDQIELLREGSGA
jgi:hypothetical protein